MARACPLRCGPMREEILRELTVERCAKCGGYWFDHGELVPWAETHGRALLAPPMSLSKIDEAIDQATRTGPQFDCPTCRLATLFAHDLGWVKVANCERCHGIFLERELIERAKSSRPPGLMLPSGRLKKLGSEAADVGGSFVFDLIFTLFP